jgi:hypothetical protein
MYEFLFTDRFFPKNATRIYDSGDAPVTGGKATVYTDFPALKPCVSPDGTWQWRFRVSGETPNHKVLSLENNQREKESELLLYGSYVAILWNGSSKFSAVTSWDEDIAMRTDVYDVINKSNYPVAMDIVSMAEFFSRDELKGDWSTRARGWKSEGILVVRCIKISTKDTDKLCAAEFSIDVTAQEPAFTFKLLRAFVCYPTK